MRHHANDPVATACLLVGPVPLHTQDLLDPDGFDAGRLLFRHAKSVAVWAGLTERGTDVDQLSRVALRWLVPLALLPALATKGTYVQAAEHPRNPVFATVISEASAGERPIPAVGLIAPVWLIKAAFELAIRYGNPALAGQGSTLGVPIGQLVEVQYLTGTNR